MAFQACRTAPLSAAYHAYLFLPASESGLRWSLLIRQADGSSLEASQVELESFLGPIFTVKIAKFLVQIANILFFILQNSQKLNFVNFCPGNLPENSRLSSSSPRHSWCAVCGHSEQPQVRIVARFLGRKGSKFRPLPVWLKLVISKPLCGLISDLVKYCAQ